jgi:hypothetical protein
MLFAAMSVTPIIVPVVTVVLSALLGWTARALLATLPE